MKSCKASITVEAAFVMPIIILTVFALLYLSFYLHDSCRIQGAIDMTLHKAGLIIKHESDLATVKIDYEQIKNQETFDLWQEDSKEEEQELQAYLRRMLSKGLFLTKIADIEATVESSKILISTRTNTPISIPWVRELMASNSHSVISGEYPIHDPAETIRVCEVILDTASQIKGVDELKNKIEGFFRKDVEE
jgi:hypothetical protein